MLIYVGKLSYPPYASNELVTVIFRDNIQSGDLVSVIHQWSKDASGKEKANSHAHGTVNKVASGSEGKKEVEILYENRDKTYYWYKGTVSGDTLTLSMWNKGGEKVADSIRLHLAFF
ncbi:hypothetical protein P170DRAFT_420640 [Aspergillus steynii IBT 23096]|uniref:Uncharacterized protein n=1 Tax=Aspergillus steynii IBT 23096 TaxID=1392250 RepID=A0A2I2GLT6_9EURO|nr:uncharacterized protein P170DRAFT_420640 [Aspergillus steynii IBT 23096]PLB53835.1 hypothetical protein P170DRAFT_420640 [Aspergillus steynii IBT 23096]